jgi:molybdate transport system ATP-binding protein
VTEGIRARFATAFTSFTLDVELDIPGRGVTVLFGHSGSGKTTILRCLAGLERARGALVVNGETWQDGRVFLPAHRRPIGYVFQEASLFAHLDVRGNLEYGYRRVRPGDRRIGFDQAVAWLGLEGYLDRSPARLSGGERQRVAIARALLTSPRMLLMDEPLSALDHRSKGEILPYLEELHDRLSIPVVYVTHSPDEAARLADRMVLLDAGRVRAVGPVGALMTALDLPLAGFDQAAAVLTGMVQGHDDSFHLTYITVSGVRMAVPREDLDDGERARIQVRAQDVSLALSAHSDTSILNVLPALVDDVREAGPAQLLVRLVLEDDQTLLARITRRSGLALGIERGRFVYAQVKSVALLGR